MRTETNVIGVDTRMRTIGIDPGLRGGMALITSFESGPVLDIEVIATPILPAQSKTIGGKSRRVSRDRYDIPAIARKFGEWYMGCAFVFIETPIPLPPTIKAGSLAQFQRGVGYGWAWMLTALGIPFELVHPRTWQSKMLKGLPKNDTKKQSSIIACQRLCPAVDLRRSERSRVPHDGLAEALLIAEYGRRGRAPEHDDRDENPYDATAGAADWRR